MNLPDTVYVIAGETLLIGPYLYHNLHHNLELTSVVTEFETDYFTNATQLGLEVTPESISGVIGPAGTVTVTAADSEGEIRTDDVVVVVCRALEGYLTDVLPPQDPIRDLIVTLTPVAGGTSRSDTTNSIGRYKVVIGAEDVIY